MKRLTTCLLLFVAVITLGRAELPPSAYEKMQSEAPEVLRVHVLRVDVQPTSDTAVRDVTILAEAAKVGRSKTKLKPGDMITIKYRVTTHEPGWVGPGEVPILKEDQENRGLSGADRGRPGIRAGGWSNELRSFLAIPPMERSLRERSQEGGMLVLYGVGANATLAVVKIMAGIWGHSNALLADGLESALDVVSSVLIWGALIYAGKPPDEEHPYGHGKLESLAAVVGAIFLIAAGASVAVHSSLDLWQKYFGAGGSQLPEPWTLVVLVVVIGTKEIFYRVLMGAGKRVGSSAMQADAWHHRSDAITSIAAFVGISVALIGGSAWQSADDWAALFSCGIILVNGFAMLRRGVGEVIDEQVSPELAGKILSIACEVANVSSAEKCRVRKSGLTLIADLHIRVSPELSVRQGHDISHHVKDRLMDSGLQLSDVTVHLEPEESI